MSQASPTATSTDSVVASSSTTIEPTTRLTTSTRRPARMAEKPIMRRMSRRLPWASQRAIAQSAIGTTQSQRPRKFMSRVRS